MIKYIAETAWHHDGDFDFMQKLINALIDKSGADIIKLHITLDLNEYMDKSHPAYDFLKERLLTEQQWDLIIKQIKSSGKELMLLLNDTKAVKFSTQYSPSYIEIHSVCLNDINLLDAVNNYYKDTPIIIGVGGTDLFEVENAISYLNSKEIILMHGFQNYPTSYSDINFQKTRKLLKLYPNVKHGYADHTAWNEKNNTLISLVGASQGMQYLEKHITINPGEERTDWQAAINLKLSKEISEKLKVLNQCEGNGLLKLNNAEKSYSVFGPNKKAALLRSDLKKDQILQRKDIIFKRIGEKVNLSQTEAISLVGKKTNEDLKKGTIIDPQFFI